MTDTAFEALCQVCSIDWQAEITKDERGRVNAALKQLRTVYPDDRALPMMIHERASAYREAYPEMPLTPQALTGNWSTVLDLAAAARERAKEETKKQRRVTNAHSTRHCDTCQGDRMIIVGEDKNGNDVATACWVCSGGTVPLGFQLP